MRVSVRWKFVKATLSNAHIAGSARYHRRNLNTVTMTRTPTFQAALHMAELFF